MPDPFERHSRSRWEWGNEPPRSQQRRAAAADEPKKAPGKKDPALCKAAHWKGPHIPGLRIHEYACNARRTCRWDVSWGGDKPIWACFHEEFCTGCGKILRIHVGREECPQFHTITADEREAVVAEIRRQRDLIATRRARRRVINGPQGYRRKRSA